MRITALTLHSREYVRSKKPFPKKKKAARQGGPDRIYWHKPRRVTRGPGRRSSAPSRAGVGSRGGSSFRWCTRWPCSGGAAVKRRTWRPAEASLVTVTAHGRFMCTGLPSLLSYHLWAKHTLGPDHVLCLGFLRRRQRKWHTESCVGSFMRKMWLSKPGQPKWMLAWRRRGKQKHPEHLHDSANVYGSKV